MKLIVKISVCVVVVVAPATVVVVVALIGGVSLDCLLKLRPEFRIFFCGSFHKTPPTGSREVQTQRPDAIIKAPPIHTY